MPTQLPAPWVAIACGGTGGHLFPGMAVGEALVRRGLGVTLLVSPKEVDQQSVSNLREMKVATLPAVALNRGQWGSFLRGSWASLRAAKNIFREHTPCAVLAMGGFTSAPPVWAGRQLGAATFLHESNSIPGRANRWLAPWVDHAFVGFAEAAPRLRTPEVSVTGTPVRAQLEPGPAAACRVALGLDPQRPVLLVMGGSQGASGINQAFLAALPLLRMKVPELQLLHLTGAGDLERVRAAYSAFSFKAVVRPFLSEIELALGAASVAVTRAGASSLAELAAFRLPALLIPYPAAADDHQFYNARALASTGAAQMLEQSALTPERLTAAITQLLQPSTVESIRRALAKWHAPQAAEAICDTMLTVLKQRGLLPEATAHSSARFGEEPLHMQLEAAP